jgi:hypothetical protein
MKHLKFLVLTIATFGVMACSNTAEQTDNSTDQSTTQTEETKKPDATTVAQTYGVSVGDKAPDFNLKNVDGEMYSFEKIKDANGEAPKGYIVVFTCNTCPYAIAAEQRLIDLHNKVCSTRLSRCSDTT